MRVWKKFVHHVFPSEGNAYRPHLLGKPWLVFFLTVILTSEGVFVAGQLAQQTQGQLLGAVLPGEVIALTNSERTQYSVGMVHENTVLDAAAQRKANDMAQKGYFAHVSPDGTEPWAWITGAGYVYQSAGENLAVRFDTSAEVVNAWMASPGHRANIVKPVYTEIGVGVAQGTYQGTPATFVVQYFGTPFAATPVAAKPATAAQETSPTASSQVAGAQTATAAEEQPAPTEPQTLTATPVPVDHSGSTILRQIVRTLSETSTSTYYILGGVASLLLLLLALAFFVHIQIQPTEMMLGGALITGIAVSFLILNSYIPQSVNTQSASVFEATLPGVISIDGASTSL